MLAGVLPASRHFARAIVMPNLVPPVVTAADARAYRDAHPGGAAGGAGLHAADDALPDRGDRPRRRGRRRRRRAGRGGQALSGRGDDELAERGARHRPGDAGAGADGGDRAAALRARRGDATRGSTSSTARRCSSSGCWRRCASGCPELRIVMEHVTTADGVAFVEGGGERRRDDHRPAPDARTGTHLLVGGIRPHYYCLPVVKRERAPAGAAAGGDRRRSRASSSAPTARRTRRRPRRRPAAAPGCSRRRWRSPAWRRSSRRRARSTGSRGSRA